MRSHYIGWYDLVEGKKQRNHEEHHPYRGKCTRRRMSETHVATEDQDEPGHYAICIQGHLEDRWAARFEGMTLTREANGDTLLTGPVVDQAALHGVLRKVRDLGMPLIAVTRISPNQAVASEVKH
jgi:hypothetical protein